MAQAGNLRRQARTNLREGNFSNPLETYGQGLLGIPQTAAQYIRGATPSSLLSDAQEFAVQNVTGMYEQATNEPIDFALDMLPITGEIRAFNEAQELRKQSEQARQDGNTEEADKLAQLATVTMSGAIPLLGMFRRMTRMGIRPEYEVKDDGVYLRVREKSERSDAGVGDRPDDDGGRGGVRESGPTEFTPEELQGVFNDPELNFAYQLAKLVSLNPWTYRSGDRGVSVLEENPKCPKCNAHWTVLVRRNSKNKKKGNPWRCGKNSCRHNWVE